MALWTKIRFRLKWPLKRLRQDNTRQLIILSFYWHHVLTPRLLRIEQCVIVSIFWMSSNNFSDSKSGLSMDFLWVRQPGHLNPRSPCPHSLLAKRPASQSEHPTPPHHARLLRHPAVKPRQSWSPVDSEWESTIGLSCPVVLPLVKVAWPPLTATFVYVKGFKLYF